MDARNPHNDLALVRRVQDGEAGALDALIVRLQCVPRMLGAKNRQLGGPLLRHEIDDLAQDVIAAVWKKLGEFSGSSTLETWVYRFCFLELMWRLRKERRVPVLLEDLSDGPPPEPAAEPPPAALEFEEVYRALDKLPVRESEAVRLKHFGDLTFVEMSDRLGISQNTIKTRYYSGMLRLRTLIGSESARELLEGGR